MGASNLKMNYFNTFAYFTRDEKKRLFGVFSYDDDGAYLVDYKNWDSDFGLYNAEFITSTFYPNRLLTFVTRSTFLQNSSDYWLGDD